MADRLSRSAPYQIHQVDIHSINDVLRQIQQAIDFLSGLSGPITFYDDTNIDGDLTVSGAINTTNITVNGSPLGTPDAHDVTYTPSDNTDWNSDADPGQVDDALDQLADRVDTLEGSSSSSSTSTDLIDADTTPWEELVGDSSMRIVAAAEGHAAQLRALEPLTVGDSLIGELQLLDDGNDEVIYA